MRTSPDDDLLRIVELIKSTEHFSEFRLKVGDIELELRHRKSARPKPVAAPVTKGSQPAPGRRVGRARIAYVRPRHGPKARSLSTLPMVGNVSIAQPAPGAPPFVDVGQVVKPDTSSGSSK